MRSSTIAALASLVVPPSAALAANDGPWCYRDFGGPQYTNCGFSSARRCVAVAGTMGGVCERNHELTDGPPARAQKRFWRK